MQTMSDDCEIQPQACEEAAARCIAAAASVCSCRASDKQQQKAPPMSSEENECFENAKVRPVYYSHMYMCPCALAAGLYYKFEARLQPEAGQGCSSKTLA